VSAGSFALNGIDKTTKVEDVHFSHVAGGYVVDLLGKTGEAKPDLHQRLKVLAAETGETMQALTEEAIRRLLMSEARKEAVDE